MNLVPRSCLTVSLLLVTAVCVSGQMMYQSWSVPRLPLPTASPQYTAPPTTAILSAEEEALFAKLDAVDDWDLKPQSLSQLADLLNQRFPCGVDTQALKDTGQSADLPVDGFHGQQIRTSSVLTHLMLLAELDWTVQDGRVLLTTAEAAEDHLRLLMLPVLDLAATPLDDGTMAPDYDSLIDMITCTVAPDSWGEGNWRADIVAGCLVFEQSWANGEQVERLLETLRRMRKNEPHESLKLVRYDLDFGDGQPLPFNRRITADIQDLPLASFAEKFLQDTGLALSWPATRRAFMRKSN